MGIEVPSNLIAEYVQNFRGHSIMDLGSSEWQDHHNIVVKLSREIVLEGLQKREVEVRCQFIEHDKIYELLVDAFSVCLWKNHVWPKLTEMGSNPKESILFYAIFFHEACVVCLLDSLLFCKTACKSLNLVIIDLIDYCMSYLSVLHTNPVIAGASTDIHIFDTEKNKIAYKISMRCLSILFNLIENKDDIPQIALIHMVKKHRIPGLFVDLLEIKPWLRHSTDGKVEIYNSENWEVAEAHNLQKLNKHQAQIWCALRRILISPVVLQNSNVQLWEQEKREKVRIKYLNCY